MNEILRKLATHQNQETWWEFLYLTRKSVLWWENLYPDEKICTLTRFSVPDENFCTLTRKSELQMFRSASWVERGISVRLSGISSGYPSLWQAIAFLLPFSLDIPRNILLLVSTLRMLIDKRVKICGNRHEKRIFIRIMPADCFVPLPRQAAYI